MIDRKDVTIIIPHLGGSSYNPDAKQNMEYSLDQCLLSLRETEPEIKKIVVKNGDTQCNHSFSADIVLRAQGQCKAVNAAVASTNTEWIFITNDDMIYPPGWFDKLVDFPWGTRRIFLDDKYFCISPMLVEPIKGAPTFMNYFCGGAGGDFDKQKFLDYASKHPYHAMNFRTGFNFPVLMKRELWDTIGGYDINYDPWGSNGDSDLQAKIHLAGIQPYQNTNSIVYHFSQTSGTSHPANRPYWEKNWHYFINKWGFERASAPDVWLSQNIIDKEKLIYRPSWMGKYGDVV